MVRRSQVGAGALCVFNCFKIRSERHADVSQKPHGYLARYISGVSRRLFGGATANESARHAASENMGERSSIVNMEHCCSCYRYTINSPYFVETKRKIGNFSVWKCFNVI